MGFSKKDAYAAEEPPPEPPERQFPDLLVNQTRPREAGPTIPPTYVPPPRTPPRRYARRPSTWPSIFLLLAVALLVGSLLPSWWTFSIQEPNGEASLTYNFLLGGQYTATCTSGTECASSATGTLAYSSHGLGAIGSLYGGLGAVVIAALALAAVACAAALAGTLGYWRGRRPLLLGTVFGILALLLILSAVISIVALQPSAFSQSAGGLASTAAPSPATSFWGACSGGGAGNGACSTSPGSGSITASWGAGVGWYLGLLAAVLLAVGLWLHTHMRLVRGQPE